MIATCGCKVPFRDQNSIHLLISYERSKRQSTDTCRDGRVHDQHIANAAQQVFVQVTGECTEFPEIQDYGHPYERRRLGDGAGHISDLSRLTRPQTLGALHIVAVPGTFDADVFLFYDADSCLINFIESVATIPSSVTGIEVGPRLPCRS